MEKAGVHFFTCHFEDNVVRLPRISSDARTVPWLRQLVVGLSFRRHGFDPRATTMGFLVDKMALGHVFLWQLRIS